MNTGLVDQLRKLAGDSIIAISIRNAAAQVRTEPDLDGLKRMIRSQAMDNYSVMEAVLGTQLLKQCL